METISMSRNERRRLEAFGRVKRGEMSVAEAARRLKVSYRQAKRIWSRYERDGDAGLVHAARGKPSNRRPKAGLKDEALRIYRDRYADHGPTLAVEYLAKHDGLVMSVSSLRRWLDEAGLLERRRKGVRHRLRRERRAALGELVQMDGSEHDWFEGRRAKASLMVLIDDATGTVTARFYERESWTSIVDVFTHYVGEHGLPLALYVDQAGTYRSDREPTPDELLDETPPRTQFGRAMDELGVELILARSAQAKGRVERMNGTLQDRLTKAMRHAGVSDLESANQFLKETFLPEFNAKFAVAPRAPHNAHQAVSPETDLECVLSFQEPRVVAKDWTVRWNNQVLQLPRETAANVRPKQQVLVCESHTGRVRIFKDAVEITWSTTRTASPRPEARSPGGPTGSSQGQRPAANHPWR